jgi:hypothetical protein
VKTDAEFQVEFDAALAARLAEMDRLEAYILQEWACNGGLEGADAREHLAWIKNGMVDP